MENNEKHCCGDCVLCKDRPYDPIFGGSYYGMCDYFCMCVSKAQTSCSHFNLKWCGGLRDE